MRKSLKNDKMPIQLFCIVSLCTLNVNNFKVLGHILFYRVTAGNIKFHTKVQDLYNMFE